MTWPDSRGENESRDVTGAVDKARTASRGESGAGGLS